MTPLFLLATLAVMATPESLVFVGDASVDIEGIYEKAFSKQRLDVTLTKTDDGWLVAYEGNGVACRVKATGPRDAIVIAPKQSCTTKVNDREHRGTLVAHAITGTLRRDGDANETFELSARLRAEDASRHVVKDTPLGKIDTWLPLGTRSGSGRFKGTRPRKAAASSPG